MINVLIIAAGHNKINGGIERHCASLIDLFKFCDSISLKTVDNQTCYQIPFVRKNFYRWMSIYRSLKKSNADIIHIHGYLHICAFQIIVCAKLLRRKVVLSPHFHPFKYLKHPFLGHLYFSICIKPLLKYVSKIVTINSDDSCFFRKYNYVMIPHWIDRKNIETSNNIKRKDNFILFVGRNDYNKGLDHLYQLPSGKYEVHCVTSGKLLRSDFVQHINVTDQELNELYMKASVLVVPSKYEAFSLVALEALSKGCPIVISDRVRIADYLKAVSGVRIFKYGDYKCFLLSIQEVICKKVDIKLVNEIFSKDAIREKYFAMYQSVLND